MIDDQQMALTPSEPLESVRAAQEWQSEKEVQEQAEHELNEYHLARGVGLFESGFDLG